MKRKIRNIIIILIITLSLIIPFTYRNKLKIFKYQEKDYNNIRDIIMGDKEITWFDLLYLDVNNDKKITSMDYVMIRNKIERDKE